MLIKIKILLLIALFLGCNTVYASSPAKEKDASPLQQTLYYGGDIITVQGDQPEYVEAVMVYAGKIIYAGNKAGAVNNFAGETIKVNLKGKTMVHGFIDLHGLFKSTVVTVTESNVVSSSMGTATDFASTIKNGKLADFVILDKNPLKVSDGNAIQEITVMETIKEGKTIYKKKTVEELHGYFAKNTVKFGDNYNFKHIVVTNQKDFNTYFGMAKTMSNIVDKVNFEENSVIAIMTKPSKVPKSIEMVYFEFDGSKLLIQYHIKERTKSTYESTGLYLAAIPKDVATVKLKSRYNVGIIDIK